jgi:hypothetical protein
VEPTIVPEPSDAERDAILAALEAGDEALEGWAAAAIAEGVGDEEESHP